VHSKVDLRYEKAYKGVDDGGLRWTPLWHSELLSCAPLREADQVLGGESEVVRRPGLEALQDVEAGGTWASMF
jgi:hypothetical protein